MRRIRLFYLPAAMLLASLSCSVPGMPAPDQNAIVTSVAQTAAALTLGAPASTLSEPQETAAPTFTFTPQPPTVTPTETQTPTPLFTATPTTPLISVSVATNCRTGPGKVYNRVGGLLVGQTAEVLGRDQTGTYWYIRNPGAGAPFCWVWGEYATLSGPIHLLPVFTPPPTPTPTRTPTPTPTPTPSPAFTLKYAGLDSCAGWWAEVRIKNTGSVPFKSARIKVYDAATKVQLVSLVNGFTNRDGCSNTTTKDVLARGESFTLSAPEFDYNPTRHRIHMEVTLCSKAGQKGVCLTKKINFRP